MDNKTNKHEFACNETLNKYQKVCVKTFDYSHKKCVLFETCLI